MSVLPQIRYLSIFALLISSLACQTNPHTYRVPDGEEQSNSTSADTNFEGCGDDGIEDCSGQCMLLSQYEEWIADGYCDGAESSLANLNCAEHDWDGGDCCASTCTDGEFVCGTNDYACAEPEICALEGSCDSAAQGQEDEENGDNSNSQNDNAADANTVSLRFGNVDMVTNEVEIILSSDLPLSAIAFALTNVAIENYSFSEISASFLHFTDAENSLAGSLSGSEALPAATDLQLMVVHLSPTAQGDKIDICFADVQATSATDTPIESLSANDCLNLTLGCTQPDACNFSDTAQFNDYSCTEAQNNFDCSGQCLLENDCNGACGGQATLDECGVCDADPSNDCVQDCSGEWGGASVIDECGECGGEGIPEEACDCTGNVDLGCGCGEAAPSGCDNTCGSTLEVDECGVCGGDGIPEGACDCAGDVDLGCGCGEAAPSGCDNTCGSTLEIDSCGVCGGDDTTCDDSDNPLDDFDACTDLSFGEMHIIGHEVFYNSDTPLGGFQFDVINATLDGASGGAAEAAGFTVMTQGNTVMGFSLTGSTIAADCGVLIALNLSESAIGIENIIVSDPDGIELTFTVYEGTSCEEEEMDCNGVCFGTAQEDNCGVCDADPTNDCSADCNGDWGGDAVEDNCGTCDADPTNDCLADCNGEWGGDAEFDDCGVCDGDGTTCQDVCSEDSDLNQDYETNVLDVVMLVNTVLFGGECAGDLNADTELNVLDIVLMVDIILNPPSETLVLGNDELEDSEGNMHIDEDPDDDKDDDKNDDSNNDNSDINP